MLKLLVRILVSAGILALIFAEIEPGRIVGILRGADLPLLLAALSLQLASSSVAAYRWQLIMRNLDFGQGLGFYWRSYVKGTFFNQGLPTSIGGDAVRMLDVARQGFRKRDAAYGVLLDRSIGLASLLALNLVAFAVGPQLLPARVFYTALGLAAAGALAFTGVWAFANWRRLDTHPQLARLKKVSVRLRRAFATSLTMLLGSSVAIHALAIGCVFAIGQAIGLDYDLLTYLVLVPPAILLTVVPVSIAGWGVREGAMVALFAFIGAEPASVLTMSITYGIVLLLASSPGFVVYLQDRQRVV